MDRVGERPRARFVVVRSTRGINLTMTVWVKRNRREKTKAYSSIGRAKGKRTMMRGWAMCVSKCERGDLYTIFERERVRGSWVQRWREKSAIHRGLG